MPFTPFWNTEGVCFWPVKAKVRNDIIGIVVNSLKAFSGIFLCIAGKKKCLFRFLNMMLWKISVGIKQTVIIICL